MESEKDNLINGLLDQINRVKEMIKEYQSLPKNAGMLASKFMELDIKKAENAIAEMNTVQMIVSFKALNEYEN